jgi:putative peptide maturation dehydrogenase
VQQVEGVAPGLYHYHAGAHALEPMAGKRDGENDLHSRCLNMVAGQHWFSAAHVVVILAPRFARSFWKYRSHAKAYRALVLDVGHLSQTLYLTATELGLGAFVTSAINEAVIETEFGLDPVEEGPLAVCGFGWRGAACETMEFDPQHRVWEATR